MGEHMTLEEKFNEIYLSRVKYYYEFDLESGIVEKDIIDRDGINFTEKLGLKAPCHFDELMKNSFNNEYLQMWDVSVDKCKLNQETFLKAYNDGIEFIEKTFYSAVLDIYNRIVYYLITDEKTGKPRVYVTCTDITLEEKSRNEVYGKLRKERNEIEDITSSAQIGIWHIYLKEGTKPRLTGTSKFYELMGISTGNKTDEEVYDFWYERVKKSSLPSVNASVQEMQDKGFSENTYTWIHPTKGEVIIRCGGTSKKLPDGEIVLRGYHSDVTETVNSETKQKQLLADALEEVQKQKKLLQEALDNYKEADYDRRRDFLTGLRNRQDMFELLQDVLSGKRENITAMMLMDIDDFKQLNDNYGHVYGDECLKRIGKALNEYSEKEDIYFYRYGGEEVLGISFKTKKSIKEISDEVVELIRSLNIKRDDNKTGFVTVSLGYTTDNKRYEKMIDKADAAMYQAKRRGKNQSVCFEEM